MDFFFNLTQRSYTLSSSEKLRQVKYPQLKLKKKVTHIFFKMQPVKKAMQ